MFEAARPLASRQGNSALKGGRPDPVNVKAEAGNPVTLNVPE